MTYRELVRIRDEAKKMKKPKSIKFNGVKFIILPEKR